MHTLRLELMPRPEELTSTSCLRRKSHYTTYATKRIIHQGASRREEGHMRMLDGGNTCGIEKETIMLQERCEPVYE